MERKGGTINQRKFKSYLVIFCNQNNLKNLLKNTGLIISTLSY